MSKRSFLLIYPVVVGHRGPKPSHDIQYNEYQCIGVPARTLGNIGDLYIDKTPERYALYAKTSTKEWKKWPGPHSVTDVLRHPFYSHYVLWCHPSTRTISWFFDLLVNKRNLNQSSHDAIHAILDERGETGTNNLRTRFKLPEKRIHNSPEGQEGKFWKKFKQTTKAVTINPSTPQTMSTSVPLEEIARLRIEATRLKDAHNTLQELVTATHPTPPLTLESSVSSHPSVSDPPACINPLPPCPDGRLGPGSSPLKPLQSDVPPGPPPRCIPDLNNEGEYNLRNSANAGDTTSDIEKEANANASSLVNTTGVSDRSITDEAVMADDAHHMDIDPPDKIDLLAEQETRTSVPLNGVDWITADEPGGRGDVDMSNFVESAGRGPISVLSEPLERAENVKHQSRRAGDRRESLTEDTHVAVRPDLDVDGAPGKMDVSNGPGQISRMSCSRPVSPRVDPPQTTPKHIMKDITLSFSDESNFRLDSSLKEVIFHVSRNSELICRLCLGTEPSHVRKFSMDAPLEGLGDHCKREHLQLCEVLKELSAEELVGLKQQLSN